MSPHSLDTPLHVDAALSTAVWGITEGAAGMISQVKGLAGAIGLPFEIRDIPLRWPWGKLWPGLVPVRRSIFAQPELISLERGSPQLVITCGRQAVMAGLYLKRMLGERVLTVHIQDPKIDTRRFDLVIAPEHDRLVGPNVLATKGAVHHISSQLLNDVRQLGLSCGLETLCRPFVTVLLGGPNKYYRFDESAAAALIEKLKWGVADGSRQLAVLPSRRTPAEIIDRFVSAFGDEHFVWQRQGENPYLCALAHCSHIVCTGDSVSMVSEASSTGKPVYVEHFRERRPARRFRAFHQSFFASGITRPFEGIFAEWTYSPPDETARIAHVLRNRLGVPHVAETRSAA